MSEKFTEKSLNIVQEKLAQANSIAIGVGVTKDKPSEQLVMFIYEKLQQEEFVVGNFSFAPSKGADIYMLPGGKNEDK